MAKSLRFLVLCSLVYCGVAPLPLWSQPARDETAQLEFFERKIRPVLINNCYNCHSANTNSKGGLRVDDRNGLITGGGRGPAIIVGQPEKSLLIQAVKHTHAAVKMPPMKHIADDEIADLAQWIKDGAAWPKAKVPASLGRYKEKYEKLRKEHWAYQPLHETKPPTVKNPAWPRNDIDRFVLAKLDEKGLAPTKDADPATLIRRVTFDLTGLPPTPKEVESFVAACNSALSTQHSALERLIDRLLASPAYGERWGRHWLDLARYGESTGSARNLPYPNAWRYRDYVIDAFNSDKPYDQFIREQIAGDLLPSTSQDQRDQQLIATGFLAIGVKDVNQRFKVRFVMDNIDEMIDAMSRSVLALTVSCARCHDHKFDPIPANDYYALAGIFQSSDHCAGLRNKMGGGGLDYYEPALFLRLSSSVKTEPDPKLQEKIAAAKAAFDKAKAEFDAISMTPEGKKLSSDGRPNQMIARLKKDKLQKELQALSDPLAGAPVAMGVRDAKTVGDTELRIRGEAEKLGPTVPRGFLTLIDVPGVPKINPQQSGRLELAQWLTNPKNTLTSRVIVNRVWHHLFGTGIVASVDNFGTTGESPSHPELLDYLAARFVREGWSIKKLVRALVLTHAYQLGSDIPPSPSGRGAGGEGNPLKLDPANRLLWRHSPRRLDAEEIRDAMLLASGKLDRTRPVGSPAMALSVIEMSNTSPLAKQMEEEAKKSLRRSVYLPLLRTLTPRSLEVFDFAEQGLVVGSRDTTTVATQALYLLNDPFVQQQANALAKSLTQASLDESSRVNTAYQRALSRPASDKENERATSYIRDYEGAARKDGVSDPNAAAWSSFCQALLASAEFRFVR
jgi:cytochrome c553